MAIKTSYPKITIYDLVKGYKDSGDKGVLAFGGKLNVRPAYQRAFVYEPNDRDRVMQSVYNNLPLNIMYWAKNADNTYEVIDGQQRIISICQFITNDDGNKNPIAINFNGKNNQTFDGLSKVKQDEILRYKLFVCECSGTDDEKLDWFHTINIAGKTMCPQELLNANYTGAWLSDAKSYFSKKQNNEAISIAFYNNYEKDTLLRLSGEDANRQALLELVLQWITDSIFDTNKNRDITTALYSKVREYMAINRDKDNARELWSYYQAVIDWVRKTFIRYHPIMKGLDWGILYNKYKNAKYDPVEIGRELNRLFEIYNSDPDGLKRTGFYEYILSGVGNATRDPSLIWHRIFSEKQKNQVWQTQGKKCAKCSQEFDSIKGLEAHHRKAFRTGGDFGETTITNCQMLCHDCHASITAKQTHENCKTFS